MRRRLGDALGRPLVAALSLLAVVALILVRPSWPLSGSITSPLTVEEVEGLAWGCAWLVTLILALYLFGSAAKALRRGARRAPSPLPRMLPHRIQPRRRPTTRPPSTFALTIAAPFDARADAIEAPAMASEEVEDGPALSVSILGPLAVEGEHRRIKRAATFELIAYLALHPKGARRDELVEAIWPGQDPERARGRLWASVTEARKALGDAWVSNGQRYELDRTKIRVDVDQLDELLSASEDDDALERALGLWRGEPLEGSDYLWADGDIRRLRATLLDLLERVGRRRLIRADARRALQLAEHAIALDRLHEPSWRLALQAEHALGLRESLTRRYEELRTTLDDELGLEPARETRAVLRELLAQA